MRTRILPICFLILISITSVAVVATSKTLWDTATFDGSAVSMTDRRVV